MGSQLEPEPTPDYYYDLAQNSELCSEMRLVALYMGIEASIPEPTWKDYARDQFHDFLEQYIYCRR